MGKAPMVNPRTKPALLAKRPSGYLLPPSANAGTMHHEYERNSAAERTVG